VHQTAAAISAAIANGGRIVITFRAFNEEYTLIRRRITDRRCVTGVCLVRLCWS
jgi:hypothetical protein